MSLLPRNRHERTIRLLDELSPANVHGGCWCDPDAGAALLFGLP
jgi:hypothetical protein